MVKLNVVHTDSVHYRLSLCFQFLNFFLTYCALWSWSPLYTIFLTSVLLLQNNLVLSVYVPHNTISHLLCPNLIFLILAVGKKSQWKKWGNIIVSALFEVCFTSLKSRHSVFSRKINQKTRLTLLTAPNQAPLTLCKIILVLVAGQ